MLQHFLADGGYLLAELPRFLTNIWNILLIILGFSLIVFVHELGHFAAAKWAGVRVERFAVGFGKELFGFTKGETRYSFNVLPLGGYVKMMGQEDFVVDKTGELKVKDDPRSFTNKSVGKRMVIVSAGVIMNLVFALVVFTIVTMIGRLTPPPVLGSVDSNLPAGRAGLQPGDRIVEIDGQPIRDFEHIAHVISLSDEGSEIDLKVLRDGKIVEPHPRLIPEYQASSQRPQIGIGYGWNMRVAAAGPYPGEAAPVDRLHVGDQITHVILDGKRVPTDKSIFPFARALYESNWSKINLVVQRPADPNGLSEAQLQGQKPVEDQTEQEVALDCVWQPLPYNTDEPNHGSLLGLVPRLTFWAVYTEKAFDKAGVKERDVVTRIDNVEFPSWPEFKAAFEKNKGKTIALEVRRAGAANHGVSAAGVDWLIAHRESLMSAALNPAENPNARVESIIADASLPDADRQIIREKLAAFTDRAALREWLDRIDIHALSLDVPSGSLLTGGTPNIDALLLPSDEGTVFVADVKSKLGDRASAAVDAGIPRFAIITAVDDQKVEGWEGFAAALRRRAGATVKVTYRHFDDIQSVQMAVPACPFSVLGLRLGDRITKINGETSAEIEVPVGESGETTKRKVILPDWRAEHALLEQNIGKTIAIEYATFAGERGQKDYAVTETNTDPWLERISPSLSVNFYTLAERTPIRNPIEALVAGTRQAYDATVNTVLTIKQLVTQNVGVKNVSGPLGIINIGAKVADNSLIDLLWLLAMLSANLAVINFLPLPIVDGGLFLFLILEKIRGEPVSIKVQVATQIVGIALIATIFILVTAQDVLKMIS